MLKKLFAVEKYAARMNVNNPVILYVFFPFDIDQPTVPFLIIYLMFVGRDRDVKRIIYCLSNII